MKSIIGMFAFAGLATVAHGETVSMSLVASASTIDTTGGSASFTISVFADSDFGTAVAEGEFALDGNGPLGMVSDMTGTSTDWGALAFQDNGYGGGNFYNGMTFGQLIFPPHLNPDPASMLGNGPVLVGSVEVTFEQDSAGFFTWDLSAGDNIFMLEIYTDDGNQGIFTQVAASDIDLGSVSVIVVPTPSTLAFLGFGGLVAGRRRR